jgi:hypothetical protein
MSIAKARQTLSAIREVASESFFSKIIASVTERDGLSWRHGR